MPGFVWFSAPSAVPVKLASSWPAKVSTTRMLARFRPTLPPAAAAMSTSKFRMPRYGPLGLPSRSLTRKVNDSRHSVLRDLLILGCYRVEACVGYEEDPDSTWREPSWLVHGMDRDEAMAFGRVFRQNVIVTCKNARPEVVVTDPTLSVGDLVRAELVSAGPNSLEGRLLTMKTAA